LAPRGERKNAENEGEKGVFHGRGKLINIAGQR
jgi:hypothetical protein